MVIGQRAGQIEQKARPVAGVDLDDRVDFGPVIVERDVGRHFELALAALDAILVGKGLARDDLAFQNALDHLRQARQAGGLEGRAVGILYPEDAGGKTVAAGVAARIHNIGPHKRQCARDAAEDAGVVGQHEGHARGVPILIGQQVDLDVFFAGLAQHFGNQHMHIARQPLPIGRIVAAGFRAQILGGP